MADGSDKIRAERRTCHPIGAFERVTAKLPAPGRAWPRATGVAVVHLGRLARG